MKTIEVTPIGQATPIEVNHGPAGQEASAGLTRAAFNDPDLAPYIAAEVAQTPELHDAKVPADAKQFDYDTLQRAADAAALQKGSFADRLAAAPMAAALSLQSVFQESRNKRLQKKLQYKTAEEQRVFLEADAMKREKRRMFGAKVLAAGLTLWTLKSGLDHGVVSMLLGGTSGGGHGAGTAMDLMTSTDQKGRNYTVDLMDNSKPLAPSPNNPLDTNPFEQALLKQYNNSDSSFYDFAKKEHRGDFGPGVMASAKDGTMPAGFGDWMSRNRHEPNGLANLVSGLKLDGHGDSLTDRNNLANIYDNDKIAQIKADILVQNQLRDPSKFSLETIKVDFPYKTTYMVDVNGDPVISMQDYTDHGGEAFKIINKQTGEVTYWRKNCGAYQQIWPVERAAQPVYHSTYAPQPARQAVVQHAPSRPAAPVESHTSTPSTPTEVIPPSTTPDTPVDNPPETPPEDYSKQGRNPGLFPDLGSGELTDEVPVKQEESATTGRDIGGGQTEPVHTDKVTNTQGTEQNGKSQGPVTSQSQDTSGNAESGKGVGDGDKGGAATSTDNGADR